MELKLPTAKVNDFLKLCEYVKGNIETDEIQKYIKVSIDFGVVTLTKTNTFQFVRYEFEHETDDLECILLESEIKKYFGITSSAEVNILFKDKQVYLTDGTRLKYNFNNGTEKVEDFYSIPEMSETKLRLDKNFIQNVNFAKGFVSNDTLRPYLNYVYLASNRIFATNAHAIYIRSIEANSDLIAISPAECKLISDFDYVDYAIAGNFNVFSHKKVSYGFLTKDGASLIDTNQFTSRYNPDSYIECSVDEVMSFCNAALTFSKGDSKIVNNTCRITLDGNTLELEFKDKEYGKSTDVSLDIENNDMENFSFNFNSELMINCLKSVKSDRFRMNSVEHLIYIWAKTDNGLLLLMAKIADVA